jgi:hypothetical protein
LNELKGSEERSKKAMGDAARLAEELRQEQEHSMHIERMRKGLEQQIKVRTEIHLILLFSKFNIRAATIFSSRSKVLI